MAQHGGDNAGIKQSSLKTLNKQSERRLVEYFIVVSSIRREKNEVGGNILKETNPNSNYVTALLASQGENQIEENIFEPMITARYPIEDHEGNPLHESVTCFCHPTGSIQVSKASMPKVHYFVSTGGRGQQMYGTVLTLWEEDEENGLEEELYLPKCLCILSTYPYLVAFREYLTQLVRLSKGGHMQLPIERYITNFCSEIPAPPPGSFEVQTTIQNSVIKFWSPPHNQPIVWVSLPFSPLFQCLDIDNILLIWHALCVERQVLVTSTQISLLTLSCEILVSLLFPMRWSHAYIPCLPHFLIPILSAPMPYLCGIDKYNLPTALFDLSRECIVVDLDMNQVTLGPLTPPLPPLPKHLVSSLRSKLEKNAGMIFREARCLSKSDDHTERGIHLSHHVKKTSDAAWEGRRCLFDDVFQLYYTPDETKKNLLNGNDGSGSDACRTTSKFLTRKEKLASSRSQSKWDGVQEAFLTTYVSMLCNYRKFLVFPAKGNEGSYGGAGFKSKPFIHSQKRELQMFLKQFVATQMFDDFITKRLYGSGEANVVFFDQAVDQYLEHFVEEKRSLLKFFRKSQQITTQNDPAPLLQSAKVHRKLKTIVPPEPSCSDLPSPEVSCSDKPDSRKIGDVVVSLSSNQDSLADTASVGSNSTGTGYSFGHHNSSSQPLKEEGQQHGIGDFNYEYPIFPKTFDETLFGTPRPLPSAVLTEFDRQRADAARFRRRETDDTIAVNSPKSTDMVLDKNPSTSTEVATFTLFFMSFTAAVGKELLKISNNPQSNDADRTILSTYKPPQITKPLQELQKEEDNVEISYINTCESDLTDSETVTFTPSDNADDEKPESVDQQDQTKGNADSKSIDPKNEKIHCVSSPDHNEDNNSHGSVSIKSVHARDDGSHASADPHVESGYASAASADANVEGGYASSGSGYLSADDSYASANIDMNNGAVDIIDESIEREAGEIEGNESEFVSNLKKTIVAIELSPRNDKIARQELEVLDEDEDTKDELNDSVIQSEQTPKSSNIKFSINITPKSRFHDTLSNFKILEAKVAGQAQLGLAFEMLDMMRQRSLKADPVAYQCLIDACGRVGDTERATKLLGRMHEDGIVADGVVYSCLVSAFSAESAWKKLTGDKSDENLPEWANGVSVEMDWNKLQRHSYVDIAKKHFIRTFNQEIDKNQISAIRERFMKGKVLSDLSPSMAQSAHNNDHDASVHKHKNVMTKPVLMQVQLGENLLELIYPDISIDTDNELCPRCNSQLMDNDVAKGWVPDSQDYTTTCPNCTFKFVPHFCVQSTSPSFVGSKGASSPLFCERLSPWVLQKELRSIMSEKEGIDNLLDPNWRTQETKNATLWWNLVLSFMRFKLPFSFLLQGNFGSSLIAPTPEFD